VDGVAGKRLPSGGRRVERHRRITPVHTGSKSVSSPASPDLWNAIEAAAWIIFFVASQRSVRIQINTSIDVILRAETPLFEGPRREGFGQSAVLALSPVTVSRDLPGRLANLPAFFQPTVSAKSTDETEQDGDDDSQARDLPGERGRGEQQDTIHRPAAGERNSGVDQCGDDSESREGTRAFQCSRHRSIPTDVTCPQGDLG